MRTVKVFKKWGSYHINCTKKRKDQLIGGELKNKKRIAYRKITKKDSVSDNDYERFQIIRDIAKTC